MRQERFKGEVNESAGTGARATLTTTVVCLTDFR